MANQQRRRRSTKVVRLDGQPWGIAHPRRGLAYHDDAVAFVAEFPIGEQFTSDSFTEWAANRGLLTPPANKYGADWNGFCDQRFRLIENLRKAARHPRMASEIGTAFDIECIFRGSLGTSGAAPRPALWKVRPAEEAIMQSDMIRSVSLALATKRRTLNQLCQGAQLDRFPVLRHHAMEVLHDIDLAERNMSLMQEHLVGKATRIQAMISAELRRLGSEKDADQRQGDLRV